MELNTSPLLINTQPVQRLGIAVSGGGDSMALLILLADWAKQNGSVLFAATVDHGLRPEAADEAQFVAKACAKLDIPHEVLHWGAWDGQGNLQDQARQARRALLADWAQRHNLQHVALGHTRDDQAETVLMRLARGSGVDGLSGMAESSGHSPAWVRPLLHVSRADLRSFLNERHISWVDDPSNRDEQFDRIKIRNAMPMLESLGLTPQKLAKTAQDMQSARLALETQTLDAAKACCVPSDNGTITVDLNQVQKYVPNIQFRIVAHCIQWVSGQPYRPRQSSLNAVLNGIFDGNAQTLSGCYLKPLRREHLIVMREVSAMAREPMDEGLYDGRWRVTAETPMEGVEIAPLGENGLKQLDNWRDLNVLRDILIQTPVIWNKSTLISAPLIGLSAGFRIKLKNQANRFFQDILSH